jgi:GNAT superfamily N-acetyltransferase
MRISVAETDEDLMSCFAVLQELRLHLEQVSFLSSIHDLKKDGYVLAYLEAEGKVVAVAGFAIRRNLALGRHLFVEDLVTATQHRSKGYGKALLDWLQEYAESKGCGVLNLVSGTQRTGAHQFYEREGMDKVAYHYTVKLPR